MEASRRFRILYADAAGLFFQKSGGFADCFPGPVNRLMGLREVRAGILDAEIGVLADQVAEYLHVPLAVHDQ